MSLKSVLLSGATGSVGAHVLSQLLSTNHHVTAIVRSLWKSSPFLTEKYSSHIKSGSLKLVEIPHLTASHAFDALAKTVDAIIHVATPLASGKADFQKEVIDPTWLIDRSILTAAAKAPSVKRVIITGSIVSTFNFFEELFSEQTFDDKSYNSATHEEVTALNNSRAAYMYAKTAAELKSWEFMEKEKPGFDLVVLLAPSIIGRSIHEGSVPSKDSLGGMSNIYQSLFDVEKSGFLFPYVM
jgi:NADPH-dependent methylglyoxal reductase